jgi:vacuolar-type H+-ATPase subunit E/Vma4
LANNSIYKKIEEKGSLDAALILKQGKAKAEALREEILAVASREAEAELQKERQRQSDLVKMKMTEKDQQAKQRTLIKKKALIDRVFNKISENLMNLDDESYKKLIVGLIKTDKIVGDEALMVSKADYARYIKLFSSGKAVEGQYVLDKLSALLKKDEAKLRLSPIPAAITGGFIISGKHFDIDHSFETLTKSLKEEHEAEIAQMLFGGE